MSAITLTLGDQAENHVGMEQIGILYSQEYQVVRFMKKPCGGMFQLHLAMPLIGLVKIIQGRR